MDTFPNLRAIEIHGSSITLTGDVLQKIGNLTQLKVLRLNHSNLFSSAWDYTNTANHFPTICQWLENSLPYFPKSLEIIELSNCGDFKFHGSVTLNDLKVRIEASFHDILPNLREINVSFNRGDEDDDVYDYGSTLLYDLYAYGNGSDVDSSDNDDDNDNDNNAYIYAYGNGDNVDSSDYDNDDDDDNDNNTYM
jgi:hypothetical protein